MATQKTAPAPSRFGKVLGVAAQRTGNWAKHGKYLLEVQKLSYFNGNKGDTFLGELKVLEATKTETTDPSPVGCVISYVEIIEGQYKDSAAGRAKAFLCDLTGVADNELDDEGFDDLVGKKQSGRFLQIRGEAFPKAKKGKSGSTDPKDYVTAWRWENVALNDAELAEILKRREAAPIAA